MLVAFWILGPVAGWLAASLRAPDGGPDASILLSENTARAFGAFIVAIVLAAAAGWGASRAFGVRSGLFAAGLVLAWPAWAAGSVMGILRRTQTGSTLWTLAAEGAMIAVAAVLLASIIARAHRPPPAGPPVKKIQIAPWFSLFALAAGVVLAGVAGAAVARSELPGQALAAAFAAGLIGTIAATAVNTRAQLASILSALALLACVGPASAAALEGTHAIHHLYEGSFMPLGRLTPLHWLAGLFLGVPVGSSWISGLMKK